MLTRRLTIAAVLSNGLGAVDVFVFLALLLPFSPDPAQDAERVLFNGVVLAVLLVVTLPAGIWWNRRRTKPVSDWLISGGPAGELERRIVLSQPFVFALTSAIFWALGGLIFTAINLPASLGLGLTTAVTAMLGGLSTAALGYLAAERIVRPVTALVLAGGPPKRPVAPGVTFRLVMAWVVATGVPVLGVAAVAVAQLTGSGLRAETATLAILFLALLTLGVGLLAIVLAARSVADPVGAVREALDRVGEGDLDARVAVDDGSEVGLLESGFNRMAAGLAERERLRDLFGRHVGPDVVRAALDGDIALGGEEREVATLFVDVVGSTALAAERPATEVVALLNRFFGEVVGVVEDNGGSVNKFEGDAAVCVFGAPAPCDDAAGAALRTARALRERLAGDPELDVGIGVSAGVAVAGNLGAEHRFEYTVIGDPVNEAARLCELAKRRPERVLASGAALRRAAPAEAARWREDEEVVLRGRAEPTRLATTREPARAPGRSGSSGARPRSGERAARP